MECSVLLSIRIENLDEPKTGQAILFRIAFKIIQGQRMIVIIFRHYDVPRKLTVENQSLNK